MSGFDIAWVVTVGATASLCIVMLGWGMWNLWGAPAIAMHRRRKRDEAQKNFVAHIKAHEDFLSKTVADKADTETWRMVIKHRNDMAKDAADEKLTRAISSDEARVVLLKETATCHICGKRDFMDNLADVGWMLPKADTTNALYVPEHLRATATEIIRGINARHAHPSCAKIKRSDDGKGWVRVKK